MPACFVYFALACEIARCYVFGGQIAVRYVNHVVATAGILTACLCVCYVALRVVFAFGRGEGRHLRTE